MVALLDASLAFPAVIYSGVLALALIYWFFVVLGALDIDALGAADGGADAALDGAIKGTLDGALKGTLDGTIKGTLEGATKGTIEGAAKGVLGGHSGEGVGEAGHVGGGGLAGVVGSLHLNRVPATVVLTLIATFGWLLAVLSQLHVSPLWEGIGLPGWLFKGILLLVSFVIALPLTSLVVRPLGSLFVTQAAQSVMDLVGKTVIISTGRVDERFGQGVLHDGGAGLILNVRCDSPGVLRQGDKAVLVSYHPEREVFFVEPMEDLLVERRIQRLEVDPVAPAGADAAREALGEAAELEGVEALDSKEARRGAG
ncbi:uncharacterized protein CMC5_031750 [Chondromyces crocatus]|uniref:DUF1449 family protein n=2 Tax=Chondromyces crocatus TaxID=52 RepID=A0A0K1EDU8_CHOCO|nr:uncharacterized protein CMC5_031750 [Chondromyces crocatus]